jgi:hypothetical protein
VLRAAGAADVLATRSAGYVIRPEPGQLDLEEFTSGIAEAMRRPTPSPRKLSAGSARPSGCGAGSRSPM